MRVITPGHHYLLDVYDGRGSMGLRFMKRVGEGYPGNTGSPHEGTNCQEVLRALIDRVQYLHSQSPCEENEEIRSHLRTALLLFEERAARIRGDTSLRDRSNYLIEAEPTCKVCGHIGEKHDHGGGR
jgi:hypothetical protein